MSDSHCPGQDMRFWRPEDIFDVVCPACQNEIEFWKDEPMRVCSQCKREILNPNLNATTAAFYMLSWQERRHEKTGRSGEDVKPRRHDQTRIFLRSNLIDQTV